MNIVLENLIEKDIINCYKAFNNASKNINDFYVSHNEVMLIKEEIKLAKLMNNIKNISHLRTS